MCGILGSVNYPFGEEVLDIMRHRGPDDCGIETFHLANQLITFGHRRLAIVDLSDAGHQPMASNCGNFLIVFNGEIYNHQELRTKLTDIPFRGHSDTETIVNYIAKYGIKAIKDLNGIFALGLVDKVNNKLHVVRDRYGVKPIYYCHSDDKFAFSSEIKPLKALMPSHLSTENLALLLKLRYSPSPYTLFANIEKVRPGHISTLDLNTHEFTTDCFIKKVPINNEISLSDAVHEYGKYFENAVKRQLMSDVDVGMWLSGGLDSALVTHFAVKHYAGKLKTFTVGFADQSEANELSEARRTAGLFDTEHHEVVINSSQFHNIFQKLISIIEEPLGTTSIIPLYYLNELVSKHVKVALSGQGADEPLGGYARYQGELYRKRIPSFLWRAMSRYAGKLFEKNEKVQRAIYAMSEQSVVERFNRTYALFSDEELDSLIGFNSDRSIETINYYYGLLNGEDCEPVEAMMSNDLRMNLSDDLLLYADKISMHFSVEARVPLLDNELVDFIESLPYQYRLRIGQGKIIHKLFAEQCLPHAIVHQKKKGFKTPAEKWFRENVDQKYCELLTSGNSRFSSHFAPEEVRKLFAQHQKGINKEKQIFTLVSIYYWMEEFI